MGKNITLSIISCVKNPEQCMKTIRHIQEFLDNSRIEYTALVKDKTTAGQLAKKLGKNVGQVHICPMEEGGIPIEKLLEKTAGTYVTFLKEGFVYEKGALSKILQALSKGSFDAAAIPVAVEHNWNKPCREHNAYLRRNKKHAQFRHDFRILNNMYFAFLLKKEKLDGSEHITPENPVLDVLRIVYKCVQNAKGFQVIRAKLAVENAQDTVSEWNSYFDTKKGLALLAEKLYMPLVKDALMKEPQSDKNAYYVCLYYTARLAGKYAVLKIEENPFWMEIQSLANELLSRLDDAGMIIVNQHLGKMQKRYLLEQYFAHVRADDSEETAFLLKQEYNVVNFYFIQRKSGMIHLEFTVTQSGSEQETAVVSGDGTLVQTDYLMDSDELKWFGELVSYEKMYEADLPVSTRVVKVGFLKGGGFFQLKNFSFQRYTPFSNAVSLYKREGDKLLSVPDSRDELHIDDFTKEKERSLKVKRQISFAKQGKLGWKTLAARALYEKRKKEKKKPVWLVSDRTNRADDNGEVMFEYISKQPDSGVDAYFVIDRGIPDETRMKKLGKTVAPFTKEHKLLFLLSDYLLSSQANNAVINPFGRYEHFYRDIMCDKRLVFLQHGITKDNQSAWLNKYNRNLFGLVCTTRPEYDSMFEYDYFYTPEHIWLTGMPRYDRLYHDEKRYITVMPTWRKSLSSGTNEAGVWLIGDDFKDSRYFNFYNSLLNDERLLAAAGKYGYKVCFMPHPNTIDGLKYFKKHKDVEFFDMGKSYREVFAQTDLMVTDYSSVAFDFAYLKKPIIYTQFDKEEFFGGEHSYTEGYFDYERDGFGEVEYDLESAVNRVMQYMEKGCCLPDKYEKRIDETFAFHDMDCSRRVYERIMKEKLN